MRAAVVLAVAGVLAGLVLLAEYVVVTGEAHAHREDAW